MAMLDIRNRQLFTRFHGAVCPKCGGDLIQHKTMPTWERWVLKCSLGLLKWYRFKCVNCEKEYKVF